MDGVCENCKCECECTFVSFLYHRLSSVDFQISGNSDIFENTLSGVHDRKSLVSLSILVRKVGNFLMRIYVYSFLQDGGWRNGGTFTAPELYVSISDMYFFVSCWLVYLRLQNKFMSYFRFFLLWYFSFESTKIHDLIPSEIFTLNLNCALATRIHTLFIPLVQTFPFCSFIKTKGKTNFIITNKKRKSWSKTVVRLR